MSPSRHPTGEDPPLLVRSLGLTLPQGFRIQEHDHSWAQLVYASGGVMSVETGLGTWVVPPQRALWVPADSAHSIQAAGSLSLRTLYLNPRLARGLPDRCQVLQVPPLVREIVLHIVAGGFLRADRPADARLARVLVDQLAEIPVLPLDLRMPSDARALRVAQRVREEPADNAPLGTLARGSGASPRTIERLFREELGLSFGRWRQQVRLQRALELLAEGRAVSAVALDVGYDSTSAFIAMFRRNLGTTPRRYYRGQGEPA